MHIAAFTVVTTCLWTRACRLFIRIRIRKRRQLHATQSIYTRLLHLRSLKKEDDQNERDKLVEPRDRHSCDDTAESSQTPVQVEVELHIASITEVSFTENFSIQPNVKNEVQLAKPHSSNVNDGAPVQFADSFQNLNANSEDEPE